MELVGFAIDDLHRDVLLAGQSDHFRSGGDDLNRSNNTGENHGDCHYHFEGDWRFSAVETLMGIHIWVDEV